MTEQEAFHKAAQDAGYESWEHAKILGPAHANEILARQASDKALADFRKDVSEVLIAWYHGRVVPGCFRRFIIPVPNPLAEVIKAMGDNYHEGEPLKMADEQRRAAERLGYTIKLERIDQ